MMRKEQFLKSIIEEIMGYSSDSSFPKISQFEIEYAGLDDEILDIYKKLGAVGRGREFLYRRVYAQL